MSAPDDSDRVELDAVELAGVLLAAAPALSSSPRPPHVTGRRVYEAVKATSPAAAAHALDLANEAIRWVLTELGGVVAEAQRFDA